MSMMTKDPILVVTDESRPMYDRVCAHVGSPSDKVLVFAPDKESADGWAAMNELNRHEVMYVTNYVQLRTITTACFPRVFIDGWKAHPQARSIAAELATRDKTPGVRP